MLNYQRVNCVIWGQSSYPWILSSALVSAAAGHDFLSLKIDDSDERMWQGGKRPLLMEKNDWEAGSAQLTLRKPSELRTSNKDPLLKAGGSPLPKYHIAPHQSLGGVYWSCAFGMETKHQD